MGTEELLELLPLIIIGGIFALVGFTASAIKITKRIREHKKYTFQITSRCVRIAKGMELAELDELDPAEKEKLDPEEYSGLSAPVFEINYNGQTIELRPHLFTNVNKVKVGDVHDIYINPENPQEYYDPQESKKSERISGIIVLVAMFIFGLFIAIFPVVVHYNMD